MNATEFVDYGHYVDLFFVYLLICYLIHVNRINDCKHQQINRKSVLLSLYNAKHVQYVRKEGIHVFGNTAGAARHGNHEGIPNQPRHRPREQRGRYPFLPVATGGLGNARNGAVQQFLYRFGGNVARRKARATRQQQELVARTIPGFLSFPESGFSHPG